MQYVGPVLMLFDGKQSAKADRNHLTEMSSTFDGSQWGCVTEVFFEDKERTIIKACCWNDRGIAAQDVRPDWKQIGFIVSVTSDDLTYQEARVVFDFWVCVSADGFHP